MHIRLVRHFVTITLWRTTRSWERQQNKIPVPDFHVGLEEQGLPRGARGARGERAELISPVLGFPETPARAIFFVGERGSFSP